MSYRIFFLIACLLKTCSSFSLGLEEKIGQLFVVPVCLEHGQEHLEKVKTLIKEKHIGGVIFMGGTTSQQRKFLQEVKDEGIPSIISCIDGEWGTGMRMRDVASLPKNLTLGAIGEMHLLKEFGREVASQCRALGVLVNFSPVVDVNSNPKNPVIHWRSFGDDPEEVSRRALAVMEGMMQGGVVPCAKHFPGHGDTATDSHLSLPRIDKSLKEMQSVELQPFKKLIKRGIPMVMIGHLLFPALSEEPASLSKEVIQGLLREELGFKGVVVTDALNMQAVKNDRTLEEICLKSLLAGADLLLISTTDFEEANSLIEVEIPDAIERIKKGWLLGEVSEGELDEKLKRVTLLKQKRPLPLLPQRNDLKKRLYRQALTHCGAPFHPIPNGASIALFQATENPDLKRALRLYGSVAVFSLDEISLASEHEHVIVSVRKRDLPLEIPEHAIVTLFDTPYSLEMIPKNISVLVGYEEAFEAKEAAADALFGKFTPPGKLPIQVSRK
ncbi:MAG: Beta-hexosaminidase [Chlamydiae bacterium]|nr:Beta-hexosaminidase [Chlamydiota bacterium]